VATEQRDKVAVLLALRGRQGRRARRRRRRVARNEPLGEAQRRAARVAEQGQVGAGGNEDCLSRP